MDGYEVESSGARASVVMEGDLKASLVPAMHKALKQKVKEGVSEIVFDFSKTAALDPSGIGLLIAASNSMELKGGKMAIVNASTGILGLLKTMRLVKRLGVNGGTQVSV